MNQADGFAYEDASLKAYLSDGIAVCASRPTPSPP